MLVQKRIYESGGGNASEWRYQDMQAYCLKCRAKREMQDPQKVTLKNGRPATQGTCPVCKTKMYRIGKA
jgi:hypothetical protein